MSLWKTRIFKVNRFNTHGCWWPGDARGQCINSHGLRWFGAVRPQAITWANVDPDLYCHFASLCHNESTLFQLQLPPCHQNKGNASMRIVVKRRWKFGRRRHTVYLHVSVTLGSQLWRQSFPSPTSWRYVDDQGSFWVWAQPMREGITV